MNKDFIYNPPTEPYLDILYEDDYIIVVNKPSGILSVPGKKAEYYDSIVSRVKTISPDATAVHRLDMSTSGIMVVSKAKVATGKLGKQFQERQTDKIYFAWVGGCVSKDEGVINLPLCVDWDNRPLQHVDYENGREAITHYICLWKSSTKSFMRLHPYTGRSHQLRVHMKELGHPILGDHLYAPPVYKDMAPHLLLHAGYLSFNHPITNQKMEFKQIPIFEIPNNIKLY
ncbi:MAG: pseudouridine synthase [Succinivibrionaceae bacterium]